MELSSKTYKGILKILRAYGVDPDKSMDAADEITELLEEIVVTAPKPQEAKPRVDPNVVSRVPDGRPEAAEKRQGNAPIPNMQGGYTNKKGEFVPTGRKVTSLMGAPEQ